MEWKGNEGKHEYKMKSTQKSGGNQQTVRRSVGVGFFFFNIERQRINSPPFMSFTPHYFHFFFDHWTNDCPLGLASVFLICPDSYVNIKLN